MFTAQDLFQNFTEQEFEAKAIEIFQHQAINNLIYNQFINHLKIEISTIKKLNQIPFLPISFFKYFEIKSNKDVVQKIFVSSGTTNSSTSRHLVTDMAMYHKQLEQSFKYFYGDFVDYQIFPLLPAYAERSGSSLIEMVDFWMKKSGQENDSYYLYDHTKLAHNLISKPKNKKGILIGVSFALLDFAQNFPMDLSEFIIMETGGMKGRKKEITRHELHHILSQSFKSNIQSEYGMTELLSQAYANKNGLFETPPWMKILLRDPEDPFNYVKQGNTGGINVIDFANIHSCSFIATDDLGRYVQHNQLEILGRFDNSDVRGCNLMTL